MDATTIVITVVIALVALAVGVVAGFFGGFNYRKKTAEAQIGSAEAEATRLVNEAIKTATQKKKEAILEAKDEVFQMKAEVDAQKAEADREIKQRRAEISRQENRIDQKENALDKKTEALEKREEEVKKRLAEADAHLAEADELRAKQMERLEMLAGLSQADAREVLLNKVDEELTHEKALRVATYESDLKDDCENIARNMIAQAISRCAADHSSETTVTVVPLPSDEMKGRIIGREGRNIRALEAATGIEIIVDDTPEAIILSGFDPVRREIARLALHQLVTDGRIHPARIEEVVAKVQKQIEEEIVEVGKRTAIDLGIHGLHPEMIRLIGKMKYRSSYGQNLLQHARETANLAGIMAAELGLNPKVARRAGLLHDIGKVPDDEPELPHAIIGMKLAEKYKEKPEVCNAIGAHHDEVEMTSLIAPIIQVCDAISGARPGARREVVESYIKRLKEMEDIALSYPGVVKTYAIQAGRELRVIVGADKLSDQESESLSHDIAKKIQDEMTYPGQVKITVIRETRAVAYAK